jgi:hypothetical protein
MLWIKQRSRIKRWPTRLSDKAALLGIARLEDTIALERARPSHFGSHKGKGGCDITPYSTNPEEQDNDDA